MNIITVILVVAHLNFVFRLLLLFELYWIRFLRFWEDLWEPKLYLVTKELESVLLSCMFLLLTIRKPSNLAILFESLLSEFLSLLSELWCLSKDLFELLLHWLEIILRSPNEFIKCTSLKILVGPLEWIPQLALLRSEYPILVCHNSPI